MRVRRPLAASVAASATLGAAVSLPAVWWEPLHADENVTLEIAPRSFGAIVERVFVEKGGAPVHFFVEHAALAWPGGIEGLRVPSLLFFVAALPGAALLARELVGRAAAALAVPLLALAPLAVGLATFGRMYSLLLAGTVWATWAGLVAGRTGGTSRWILAGAALGSLVYLHPLAPLYSALGLVSALLWSRTPGRRRLLESASAVGAYGLVQLPFFLHGLGVNRERYMVSGESDRIMTTHGRSTPVEIVHALAPLDGIGAAVFAAFAVAGLLGLARQRPRAALILSLWILVPIVFFWVVPAGGTRFFDRYVLPQLPAFLLAVAAGCLAAGRLLPSRRLAVAVLAAGALIAAEGADDLARLDELRRLDLRSAVGAVADDRREGILFASTGRTTLSRPPRLLARYLTLELGAIPHLAERGCAQVRAFVGTPAEPRVGLWIFRGRRARIALTRDRLAGVPGVVTLPLSSELLLVRTARREDPRRLIELGTIVRRAWLLPEYGDGGVKRLIRIGGAALDAAARGVPCSKAASLEPTPFGRPYAGFPGFASEG